MHKLITFIRYLADYARYGQMRLMAASIIFVLTKKSFVRTRLFRGKLGYFLHRKGTLDFQFGNYAYEWNVKKCFIEHSPHYNIFIDIGANIGTYTIMLAGKGMRTYAFEPVYENYKALKINVMLNNLEDKTTLFNVGLSNRQTTATFAFDPLNTGASHLDILPAENEAAELRSIPTTIQLTLLDNMYDKIHLNGTDKVLVKIDVEGMETEVLKGATNFIKSQKELFLIIESVHSGEENLKAILNSIAKFEYYPIDELNFAAKKIDNL
ncbi:MAG: FkbM family methyltransferase [Bacteroidales bacterium]|nr:FkbM family methyltransferase [Bacteroidales bacterium]